MLPALLLCVPIQDAAFDLPPGFVLTRAAAERHGYLALCDAGPGRLVLSTEREGLLLARDEDGDGWFEQLAPLGGGIEAAQGLLLVQDQLFVVGRRGDQVALWRGRLEQDALLDLTPLLAFVGGEEHGAHGILQAADGRLLVTIGDGARALVPATNADEFTEPARVGLPVLPDPGGFGRDARWPFGHVAAVDPRSGEWELLVAGLRNAYDLAARDGQLFTVDSDMEWDVGLPWYREVRALRLSAGDDHGSRSGSGTQPSPEPLARLGRASPTGMTFGAEAWPARWREALLVGDWINARITAVHVGQPPHAGSEVFVQAKGAWNVTDLTVGADGALYIVSGGRGTPGDLYRLAWVGGVDEPSSFEGLDPPAQPSPARLDSLDVAGLLAQLDQEDDPVERLRIGDHLRTRREGWNGERAAAALDLFEQAAGYTGGGNLQGYVRTMLEQLLEHLPQGLVDGLARDGRLGPRALATLLARTPGAGHLVAPLAAAFAALDEGDDLALAQERKRALLLSLVGADAPGLDEWLRAVHDDEPRLVADVLLLLAARPRVEDFERLRAGLEHGSWEVRQACARSLLALDRRPQDAGSLRTVLDEARQRGPRGGPPLLAVLTHWSGYAPENDEWTARLAEWERWFRARFPDWTAPERGPADGPAWDLEAVASFLEGSATRPGSAARGAAVFRAATCDRCHTLGTIGSGWAPDLTGVTQRFELRALLDAVVNPSALIADRYETTEVTTVDGERLDGRLVRESADTLELLLASGARVIVPRSEVVTRAPSPLSAMPEELLTALTLEQIKDLLAYLAANGQVEANAARGADSLDLLADGQRSRWSGSFAGWKLERGVLAGRMQNLERSSYLVFDGVPDDFELEFDVHCAGTGNSGVQYRSRLVEGAPHPVGYQVDVGAGYWGSVYATDGRALLAGPVAEELARALDPDGWNHFFVRVRGDRHQVELNGVELVDLRDDVHGSGVLALQLHEGKDARVYFTNLRLLSR